jgi:hypothetical protein
LSILAWFAAVLSALLALPAMAHAAPWTFTDVTAAAGVSFSHGYVNTQYNETRIIAGGVAAGDYDGDGWIDLYAVRGTVGKNLLFHNRGDGSFEEVGEAAGVALDGVASSGPVFADYDGDGDLDLFVGGVDGTPPTLFRNRGDGTFKGVTAAAGLVFTRPTFSAAFGDYDRDGDLDLATSHWLSSLADGAREHLWRNDGGKFTDVSAAAGIVLKESPVNPGLVVTFAPTFADLDADGWPELLFSSDFRVSQIFHNDHGSFHDVTTPVISDENGMGSAVADYDEDGDLDWFVSSIWDPVGVNNPRVGKTGNRLYRNRGDGTFEDVTDVAGVREGFWGWGSTFADLNNDGHLDLFHVNGFGVPDGDAWMVPFLMDPARLFVSDGDGTFTQSAEALGIADQGQGRGVVAFDYDRDGDLDLYIANNGQESRLYRNDGGNAGNYLAVKLRGRAPNTQAVGARIFVTAGGRRQMRELHVGSNFVSQDPVEAHFGLGTAASATEVEIVWPDGEHKLLGATPANRLVVVTEPGADVDAERLERKCILALSRGGASIAAAVTRRFMRCIQQAGAGKLPAGESASQCLEGDPSGDIAAATKRAEKAAARVCVRTPTFGPQSVTEVSAAMLETLRVEDLFGPSLDEALIDGKVDRKGAACQASLAAQFAAIVLLQIDEFNVCVAKGLEDETIRSTADLQGCFGADAKGRVAGKIAAVQRTASRRCADTPIAEAFPGKCAGVDLENLAECLEKQASCGVCTGLNGADRTAAPCHHYTDGIAAGADYCGDKPAETHSIARQWDEELLNAIRKDTPRPTVHARNLIHLSAVMWDTW